MSGPRSVATWGGDTAAFIECARTIAKDRDLVDRLRLDAWQRAQECTWADACLELEQVYRSVLVREGNPSWSTVA